MKNIFSSFIFTLFSACCLHAQQSVCGIYKNENDYKNNILSYVINCSSKNGQIKLHHFFAKNYIDIIADRKKTKLYKDSIFGYRDCKQNDYRFYKNNEEEYKIIENRSIVIYTSYIPVISSTGKVIELKPCYFFSLSLHGAILPLTILNLKITFPDDLKFHDLLDITFSDDTALWLFDSKYKMYTINFLLSKSLK